MSDNETPDIMGDLAAKPRKPRNWLKIALGVSLAVNMLIVGFAAGAAWRFHKGGGPRGVYQMTERLQEPARANVRRILEAKRTERRAFRQRMQRAREAAAEAMLMEPFDKARFTEAKENLIRTIQAGIASRFDMLPEIAAELSLDERRELLHVLRRSGRGMRRALTD